MAELPYKFWANAETGEIVPVGYHHALTVLENPEKFGLPPGMKGTPYEHYARLAQTQRWSTDDYDSKLYQIMFTRGWVRSDNTGEDALNLETSFLPDASKVLKSLLRAGHWFTDVYMDFDHVGGTPPDPIHLDDSDQIEAFADRGVLPRRYLHALHKDKRMIRPDITTTLSPELDQIGTGVGDRMESFIERARALKEARPPTRRAGRGVTTATPGETLPGRIAEPGEVSRIQVPHDVELARGFAGHLRTVAPDSVSNADAARHAGRGHNPVRTRPATRLAGPQQPRLTAPPGQDLAVPEPPAHAVVPLNRLPVVAAQGQQELHLTWHAISSFPGYMVDQIRAAFRPLFKNMMNAELEEVSAASDMPGAGTSKQDIQRLWNFLLARGRVDDQFDLEAFGIDPNLYSIKDAHVVTFGGHVFFMMIESHRMLGDFRTIYVAPGKGRETTGLDHHEHPPMLTHESLRMDKVTIPFNPPNMTAPAEPPRIVMSKDASGFLSIQSTKYRRQIADHVNSLLTNPFPSGVEKLHYEVLDGKMNLYRMRVGKARIIYGVQGNPQQPEKILIFDIGLRKEVYSNAGGRERN